MKNLTEKALKLKECLDMIRSKKRLLSALQRQLAQAKADCSSLQAVDYANPNFKSSPNTSSEERYVEHLEKIRHRINSVMQEVFDMEDFIAENISSLNDYEQAMIIDRYIHGKSWKRICSEYNYAYDEKHNSAYNIVSKALKKL